MIRLGFSPCPNDTSIFYAIANRKIDLQGLDFDFYIDDVEVLNHIAVKREVDISKVSCHAFYYLQDDYQFLRSGGAFGRKCGPLLVQKSDVRSQNKEEGGSGSPKIAIPGNFTTAFLLLKLYLASSPKPIFDMKTIQFITMPFHTIMEAVSEGGVDAGLIIHESRFTYQDYGLKQIIDLGDWWERETKLPIPLGGIVAKRSLGALTLKKVEDLIRSSVQYFFKHKNEAIPFIKKYSQELSDEVILKHISLYVNDYTIDIGSEGEAALNEFLKRTKLLIEDN